MDEIRRRTISLTDPNSMKQSPAKSNNMNRNFFLDSIVRIGPIDLCDTMSK